MKRVSRIFTREFKRRVVEEVRSGLTTQAQAARQYDIVSSLLYTWIKQYERGQFDNEPTAQGALENKVAGLERKVGQLTMENELLKKAREWSQRKVKERLLRVPHKDPSVTGAAQ